MKNEFMSIERYEKVLDMLENDKNAFSRLSKSEQLEIRKDGYAMELAAKGNITNLQHLSRNLRYDQTYMRNLIRDVNSLAMCYCPKTWFRDKYFVEFLKQTTANEAKNCRSSKLRNLYSTLIEINVQKAQVQNKKLQQKKGIQR